MQFAENIDVWVLCHRDKQTTTGQMLLVLDVPFTIHLNQDWRWPADHPELQLDRSNRPQVRDYALRQYRAFRGHQEIMRQCSHDRLQLIFEDDASLVDGITSETLFRQIAAAANFITQAGYDAVSFHGRNQTPPQISRMLYDREYVELSAQYQPGWGHQNFLTPVAQHFGGKYQNHVYRWHEGCLAYLVGPRARAKWIAAGHGHGMPCDLFLVNELHTIVLRDTVFQHDQRHGSLISNTVARKAAS